MQDIFGKALYRYWKGDRRTPYTIRREDGYVDTASMKEYFARQLEPTEKAVDGYVRGNVLDIGCGAGRHLLHYQGRGCDITGIDHSPLAVQVCKKRGCKKAVVTDVFHPALPLHGFDTLLLFGNNIGIGGTLVGAAELLSTLRTLVKPDGHLLLTSIDVAKTNSTFHRGYHEKIRSEGRYMGELTIRIEYKGEPGEWFNWLHVDSITLEKLAHKTGWEVVAVHEVAGDEYAAVLRPSPPHHIPAGGNGAGTTLLAGGMD